MLARSVVLTLALLVVTSSAQFGLPGKLPIAGSQSNNTDPCSLVRCAAGSCRVRNGQVECAIGGSAPLLGALRDLGGCIPSAGYSWCALKNKCLRASDCVPETPLEIDKRICKTREGYAWCDLKKKCIHLASESCGQSIGARDEKGCILSAGYSWCGLRNKCLRNWEEACEKPGACPDPVVKTDTSKFLLIAESSESGCTNDRDCDGDNKCCRGSLLPMGKLPQCSLPKMTCENETQGFTWCAAKAKCVQLWEEPCNPTSPIAVSGQIIGARDPTTGCVPSAGYTWCDKKSKCLRLWEEKCEEEPIPVVPSDENNCIPAAGYMWCTFKGKCLPLSEALSNPLDCTDTPLPENVRSSVTPVCLGGAGYTWCEYKQKCLRLWEEKCTPLLGADSGKGCIATAGYSWCERKSKCLRTWEEVCNDDDKNFTYRDSNGCIPTAGYTWCDKKSKCLRLWEEKCEVPSNATVGTTDANGCFRAAGYYWCDGKQKCLRPWEEACTTIPLIGTPDASGCIPTAGYQWCDAKQKCIRSWEEACEATPEPYPEPIIGAVTDDAKCVRTAGYTFCASTNKCQRLWEEPCPSSMVDLAVLSGSSIPALITRYGSCIGAAGYRWCSHKKKCLRSWEESCEVPMMNTTTGCIESAGYSLYHPVMKKCVRPWEVPKPPEQRSIGGIDGNGCIPTAGYTFCQSTGKCQRLWEEKCPDSPRAQAGKCLLAAGYTWCDKKSKCLRLWEEACDERAPLLGGSTDKYGCTVLGGYQWCDVKQKCLRPWEEKCEVPVKVEPALASNANAESCKNITGFAWCASKQKCMKPWTEPCVDIAVRFGATDAMACLGSAGYSWCEKKGKCLRTWEEPCDPESAADSAMCLGGAGYTWCESKKKCVRLWEEPCGLKSVAIRGADLQGCIRGAGYVWCGKKSKCLRLWEEKCEAPSNTTGGARDDKGCIPSAGYRWCDSKSKCLRLWEEPCTSLMNVDAALNSTNGCMISAGYSYCATKSKCLRLWEEECPKETPAPLNIGQKAGTCLGSAGYSFCQIKNKCLRPWEEKCEDNKLGAAYDANGCIPTAGYTWCNEKKKCLRAWEEPCSTASSAANTCLGGAGYTWCEAKKKCLRPWEESCGEGSLLSAGSLFMPGMVMPSPDTAPPAQPGDAVCTTNASVCSLEKSEIAQKCLQDIVDSRPGQSLVIGAGRALYTRYMKGRANCARLECQCRARKENTTYLDVNEDGEGACVVGQSSMMSLAIQSPSAVQCLNRADCAVMRRVCERDVLLPIAKQASSLSTACQTVATSCNNEQLNQECQQSQCDRTFLPECPRDSNVNYCRLFSKTADILNNRLSVTLNRNFDTINDQLLTRLKNTLSRIINVVEAAITLKVQSGSVIINAEIAPSATALDPSQPKLDTMSAAIEVAGSAEMQSDYEMEPSGVTTRFDAMALNGAENTDPSASSNQATEAPMRLWGMHVGVIIGACVGCMALVGIVAMFILRKRSHQDESIINEEVHMNEVLPTPKEGTYAQETQP